VTPATVSRSRRPRLPAGLLRQSYLFPVLLLLVALAVMYQLNPNFFKPSVLAGNLRPFLPLMLLAVGQTIVVIGGGIDLSVGAMVSLCNVVMVRLLGSDPQAGDMLPAALAAVGVGLAAGALNGFCVSYLRFQPIVTTFATSFIFGGAALWVLPTPGGKVPQALKDLYGQRPLGISMTLWVALVVLLIWGLLRTTRYRRYLYASGGDAMAAYVTGVPVSLVRMSTYIIAGFMAALSAFALTLSTGTGDAALGAPLTLGSVVAVVLGGTRLSGGQGGIAGSLLGVVVLGLVRIIISFANVDTWSQTLVDSLIIVLALAGPGLFALLRRLRA
jgi:ribose transport system permease protein